MDANVCRSRISQTGDQIMQQDITIAISGLLGLIVLLIPVLCWTVIATRRGIANSDHAIRQVEEGLALSRRSVEIGEETLKQQEEIIELLREICKYPVADPGSYKSAQS